MKLFSFMYTGSLEAGILELVFVIRGPELFLSCSYVVLSLSLVVYSPRRLFNSSHCGGILSRKGEEMWKGYTLL